MLSTDAAPKRPSGGAWLDIDMDDAMQLHRCGRARRTYLIRIAALMAKTGLQLRHLLHGVRTRY